jgi:2-desacetyl-2-hydroxyethyl bacteriochlorophyllide A dehydrogenase
LNAVHDGELRVGERVLVVGLGAVGTLITRIAVLAGAEEVTAYDPIPARRRLAERWGAQPAAIDDLVSGTAFAVDADVVFEASGNPDAFATASACCASHGRIVVVSTYAAATRIALPGQQWAVKQPTIAFSTSRPGTHVRAEPRWNHARLLAAARHLLSSGRITAEDLVTATLPIDRAADAYRLVEEGRDDALCAMFDYGQTTSR